MTLYLIIAIVAIVAGAVMSRILTLRAVAKLAKEAGADEEATRVLSQAIRRQAESDRKRRPLAVRGLGNRWRDLRRRRRHRS